MNSKCCSWSLIGLPVIFLHIAAFVKIKKGATACFDFSPSQIFIEQTS